MNTTEPEKDIFEQWAEERESRPWIIKKLRSLWFWLKNEAPYLHIEFIRGCKSLIYWMPIIWKDRHWDSSYIFEIMMHKIKAQSKYIGDRDIHVRAKRDAEVMMTCVKLMKLVQEETYIMEYHDYRKLKTWFEDVEGSPGYSSWNSKVVEENFDDYFKKYPLMYKRVLAGEGVFRREGREEDKEIIAMNIAHLNHERARKLVFKILEQNIESWWD